jgi:transposase
MLPNKARGVPRVDDRRLLNGIERFFNKIKQCRQVATRYDRLAANYLAFIQLACIRLWLRVNESTS